MKTYGPERAATRHGTRLLTLTLWEIVNSWRTRLRGDEGVEILDHSRPGAAAVSIGLILVYDAPWIMGL